MLFHDGTYHWFGEHRTAGETVADIVVHGHSFTDLYHGMDEGTALGHGLFPFRRDPASEPGVIDGRGQSYHPGPLAGPGGHARTHHRRLRPGGRL